MLKKRLLYIFISAAFIIQALFLLSCGEKPLTYSPGKCAVLAYHAISDSPPTVNAYLFVSTEDFEKQIFAVAGSGVNTVFARDVLAADKAVSITFDDGYDSVYTEAFPILKKYSVKATVFIISGMVGKNGHLSLSQMSEMEQSGLFSFESHTASHADLTAVDKNTLASELSESYFYLKSETGIYPFCIAYPYGRYNKEVEAEAIKYGYICAFTTEYPKNDKYSPTQIPRVSVFRDDGMTPIYNALEMLNK